MEIIQKRWQFLDKNCQRLLPYSNLLFFFISFYSIMFFKKPPRYVSTVFTFTARGPLGPLSKLNSTSLPSSKASKSVPSKAERWKKTSFPSSALINPNPLSLISFLIFPFKISPPLDEKFYKPLKKICRILLISHFSLTRFYDLTYL